MTDIIYAPQLMFKSEMLHLGWIPAAPERVAQFVPEGLTFDENGTVYMNQYRVNDPQRASSNSEGRDAFGTYSLTYLGVDMEGLGAGSGVPGQFWTHYYNSSASMNRHAAECGVSTSTGSTTLEKVGRNLVATSFVDGEPMIRAIARFPSRVSTLSTGQLRYVTHTVEDGYVTARYPFVADLFTDLEVESLEFLDPDHELYAFRPAEPLQVTFRTYSPSIMFCYPSGEGPLSRPVALHQVRPSEVHRI